MAHSQEDTKKLGVKLFTNPSFHHRFQSCIWESETPGEFEGKWATNIKDLSWIELNG